MTLMNKPFYITLPVAALIVAATWTLPSIFNDSLNGFVYNLLELVVSNR